MNDNRCPLCNFEISASWSDFVIEAGRYAAEMTRTRFAGAIIACPECLPPVVVPKVFH